MNYQQVHALDRLMFYAQPPRRLYDDESEPKPNLYVALEVAHGYDDGNTYEARLWSTSVGYRFEDVFYLRGDGKVYVYDSEADLSYEVKRVRWVYPEARGDYRIRLSTEREQEPLAELKAATW